MQPDIRAIRDEPSSCDGGWDGMGVVGWMVGGSKVPSGRCRRARSAAEVIFIIFKLQNISF